MAIASPKRKHGDSPASTTIDKTQLANNDGHQNQSFVPKSTLQGPKASEEQSSKIFHAETQSARLATVNQSPNASVVTGKFKELKIDEEQRFRVPKLEIGKGERFEARKKRKRPCGGGPGDVNGDVPTAAISSTNTGSIVSIKAIANVEHRSSIQREPDAMKSMITSDSDQDGEDQRHRQRSRIKSPPPYDNALEWPGTDSIKEAATGGITKLEDVDGDDGYGINRIGYKPTPQVAWARSQKRKQQVEEWKKREAKEARTRRMETRLRKMTAVQEDDPLDRVNKKRTLKVHFAEV